MVVMGRIHTPYGIRGWVNIFPDTEILDSLLDYPTWWINTQDAWRELELEVAKVHGDHLVAKLKGIDDRDQAFQLKGRQIAVPRSQLPEPEAGEYYWSDLVGMAVNNLQQIDFGRVDEVFATGANDVLVVKGDRERLIPFVDQVVQTVDPQNRRIVVDWDADF